MNSKKEQKLCFEAYGITLSVKFPNEFEPEEIKECIKNAIPVNLKFIKDTDTEHKFIIRQEKNKKYTLQKNAEDRISFDKPQQIPDRLESLLRLTVGEFADSKVFIHAGVVALDGKAIIIPARSFRGKTTLVVELIKAGAVYYSDEYAVVDEKGFIYPFPKRLSVRGIIDDYTQIERSIDFYGGKAGKKKIKAGLILVTEYAKKSHWKPELLGQGEAVLELISNTLPIRNKPEFSIKVLNKIAEEALAVKTKRGEAKNFVKKLINFYKNECV